MTTNAGETHVDQAAAEEFAGRLVGILSDSALALMISIGHQVGLFDTLAQLPRPRARRSPKPPGWTSAMCTSGSGR
jgi:hypothetical protein